MRANEPFISGKEKLNAEDTFLKPKSNADSPKEGAYERLVSTMALKIKSPEVKDSYIQEAASDFENFKDGTRERGDEFEAWKKEIFGRAKGLSR